MTAAHPKPYVHCYQHPAGRLVLDAIRDAVECSTNIKLSEMTSGLKRPDIADARRLFTYVAVSNGYRPHEIQGYLCTSLSSIANYSSVAHERILDGDKAWEAKVIAAFEIARTLQTQHCPFPQYGGQ